MYNKYKYLPNTVYLRTKGERDALSPTLPERWLRGQGKTTLFRSVKLGIGTLLIGAALFGASQVFKNSAETTGKPKEVFW